MKVKSLIFSFIILLGGVFGSLLVQAPVFLTDAATEDASLWDGNYDSSASDNDFYRSGTNYYIHSADGFSYFAYTVRNGTNYGNATIYLTTDINLGGRAWTPIGKSSTTSSSAIEFRGTFNGQGHTIFGLSITSGSGSAGLFSSVSGTIDNLHLSSVNISANNCTSVGALVGQLANGGRITNCSVRGNVQATSATNVGGLVGSAIGATISNSVNHASVVGGINVGGLVGSTNNNVSISESFNEGTISSSYSQSSGTQNINVGGLVGSESSLTTSSYLNITNSYNAGSVVVRSINTNAGGILGYASTTSNRNYFKLQSVYNKGDFNLTSLSSGSTSPNVYVGGIVGFGANPTGTTITNGLIENAFNVGNVAQGANEYYIFSEIINFSSSQCSLENVYYDYDSILVEGGYDGEDYNYAIRTAHLDGKATNIDFVVNTLNFSSSIWAINNEFNDAYPYLINTIDIGLANGDNNTTSSSLWLGGGTQDNPYLIYTAEDLARVADRYNGKISGTLSKDTNGITYFSLQNSLDLSSKAWDPIGINNYYFENAVFDGNNFTITGINCSLQVEYGEAVGLFGSIDNAIIRDVIVGEFRYIGQSSTNPDLATLVGKMENSYIINCADFSDTGEYSIYSSSNSYIIYGKNNISGTDVRANITSGNSTSRGYLVSINTDGGAYYDVCGAGGVYSVHKGVPEFIITGSTVYGTMFEEIGALDPNYIIDLPTDTLSDQSEQITSNTIVKEGYRINGFLISGTGVSFTEQTLCTSYLYNLVSNGIIAQWQEMPDVEYKIYYNSYERFYNSVDSSYYSGVTGQNGDNEEDKYISIEGAYNTFWSVAEFNRILTDEIGEGELSREGYGVVGIWEEITTNSLDPSNPTFEYGGENIYESGGSTTGFFLNSSDNYFIEWEGVENYNITFTLLDAATKNDIDYLDRFTWEEAVESVVVSGTTRATTRYSRNDGNLNSDGVYNFSYNAGDVDKYGEEIYITITLRNGFMFDTYLDDLTANGFVNEDGGDINYIGSYGQMRKNRAVQLTNDFGQYYVVYTLSQFVGEGEFELCVRRTGNDFDLTVDKEVKFVLTMPTKPENPNYLEVLTSEGFVSVGTYNQAIGAAFSNNSLYFGLNMFDNYMIVTNNNFGFGDVTALERVGGESLYLTINENEYFIVRDVSTSSYYAYELSFDEATNVSTMSLYLVEGTESSGGLSAYALEQSISYGNYTFEFIDRLASISYDSDEQTSDTQSYYNINFLTNAEFGLVFSTEAEDVILTDYGGEPIDENGDGEFEVLVHAEDVDDAYQKIYYDFSRAKAGGNNFYSLDAYIGSAAGDDSNYINVSTANTTARFYVQLVDENGNQLLTDRELPSVYITNSNNVLVDAISNPVRVNTYAQNDFIEFTIVNTYDYQWAFRGNIGDEILFNELSETLEPDVNMYINIISTDDDGALDQYPEREEGIEPVHSYFEVISAQTGGNDRQNKTAYSFYLYYNYYGQAFALPSFDFMITFVVKEVEYGVMVETKFRQEDTPTSPLYDDDTHTSELKVDDESSQGTSIKLHSDNGFSLSTSAITNLENPNAYQGYNFYGFRLYDEEFDTYTYLTLGGTEFDTGSDTIADLAREYGGYLDDGEYNLSSATKTDGFMYFDADNDRYMFRIQSIYTSKDVNYIATMDRYAIDHYNGWEEEGNPDYRYYYRTEALSNSLAEGSLVEGIYYYSNNPTNASGLIDDLVEGNNFVFEMQANGFSRYYRFVGVALMTRENYYGTQGNKGAEIFYQTFYAEDNGAVTIAQDLDGNDVMTFNAEALKEIFYNDIVELENQTIYLVPIIEQKTLLVNITSGTDLDVTDIDGNQIPAGETVQLKFYYNEQTNLEFNAEYLKQTTAPQAEYNRYYLVSDMDSVVLNEHFYDVIGYYANGWIVNDTTPIALTYHRIDRTYFTSDFAVSEGSENFGQYDYEITISRTWTANTYTINFNSADQGETGSSVYGVATGRTESVVATYGIGVILPENGFAITGYSFVEWNTQIDGEGDSYQPNEDVSNLRTGEEGDDEITLYAIWEAKEYNIRLVFNSGNYQGEEEHIISGITYNTAITGLSDIVPERNGFIFDGYFLPADNDVKLEYFRVSDGAILNTGISGFVDYTTGDYTEEEMASMGAITLYATWIYDGEADVSVENSYSTKYTGVQTNVPLSHFNFQDTNITIGEELTCIYDDVEVSMEFVNNDDVSYSNNNFTLQNINVGNYSINGTITLTDSSERYSNGRLQVLYFTLNFEITVADLSLAPRDDYSLQLANIKYLVGEIENSETVASYQSFGTFEALANSVKANDESTVDLTYDQIYEYQFMKYFLLLNSTAGEFREIRNWTYEDYLAYFDNTTYYGQDENVEDLEGVRQERKEVLANSLMLFSYDILNQSAEYTLYSSEGGTYVYSPAQFEMSSTTSQTVKSDVSISSIATIAPYNMTPNNSYEVRAYIEGNTSGILNNYSILVDTSGRNYITLGYAYMLVDVLKISNRSGVDSTFFNVNAETVSVDWTAPDEEEYIFSDYLDYYYYQTDSNLYVHLEITTSNTGNADVDTLFNFYDSDNYLIVNNARVINRTAIPYSVSANYNVILDESFNFTIYNINDTSRISLDSSFLTKDEDGFIMNLDLPEELTEELFVVTGITYSLDGTSTLTISNENGLDNGRYFSEDGGTLLLILENNNSANPVIYSGGAVTGINISVSSAYLNEYTRIIGFGQEEIYEFTGEGTVGSDFVINTEELEYEEGVLTELSFYATYSDLVYVEYDMNLPIDDGRVYSYLQLGVDTADDVLMVTADYLELSRLMFVESSGNEISYEQIFTGSNGEYVGYTSNIFAPIMFKAYWRIGEISVNNLGLTFTESVGALNEVYATEVGQLYDDENEMFTYSYEIIFNNGVVARSDSFYTLVLELENGGSLLDNGTYTIRITVEIKDEYAGILDEGSGTSITNEEISFVVDLKPIRIIGATLEGETPITYDGADHILEIGVNLTYEIYNSETGEYETQTNLYGYGQTGGFEIQITNNSLPVTSLINAGTYEIVFAIDENFYENNGTNLTFEYVIDKYNLDLSAYEIALSKKFNAQDGNLTFNLYAVEQITLNLNREQGEDIGEYDLFLTSFTSLNNNNFTVSFDDVMLYDGETDFEENLTSTAVGSFTITASDVLRLSWTVTEENPQNLEVEYDVNGYTAHLDGNGNLVILAGTETAKTIALSLYDVSEGSEITRAEILNIIRPLLSAIQISFYNSEPISTAINSALYTFLATSENNEINNYYTDVAFATDYSMQIVGQEIDVSSFNFVKVYDGTDVLYLDTLGNRIEDLETYSGVYITATYSDYHARNNMTVRLMLSATEGNNYGNYALSESLTTGSILKRDATLTFTMDSTYTYGELNSSLLSNVNLSGDTIGISVTDSDENLTSIFEISSYNLVLGLTNANGVNMNPQGYFYASEANYTLSIGSSTFDDFNFTAVNLPSFTITPYEYNIQIPESYIVISVLDEVAQYYPETRSYTETGDTFEVQYVPVGAVQGVRGLYDLTLNSTTYANGNITVNINEDNNGFEISRETNAIYLEIQDTLILTQDYSGSAYSLQVTLGDFTLQIEAGETQLSSEIRFFSISGDNTKVYLDNSALSDITSLNIFYSENQTSFENAGAYKLSLSSQSENYPTIALADNYYFTINPLKINLQGMTFTKVYDGTNTLTITDFNGKISGDDVELRGVFAGVNAGNNLDITFYLSGTDAINYVLANDTFTGSITKADATITLSETSYQYGYINSNSELEFVVTAESGISVSSTQYTVSNVQILNASYSTSNNLNVNTYQVSLQVESTNYNITIANGDTLGLNIIPYELDFLFTTDGLYMTTYSSDESRVNQFERNYGTPFGDTIVMRYTRVAGSIVGYYHITGGEVVDNGNYRVSSVSDNSPNGAYRIVASTGRLYLLASELDEITSSNLDEGRILSMTYDGITYDQIEFVNNQEEETYLLRLTSSQNLGASREFAVNIYGYDETSLSYQKLGIYDSSITAQFRFENMSGALNVGDYMLYVDSYNCDNFDIVFGKNNTVSPFVARVNPIELYFGSTTISKVFDNKEAILSYVNASDVLNGILVGDEMSLTITFYDEEDNVAIYAGDNYRIEAVGNNSNYHINLTTNLGTQVVGEISKAPLDVYVESVSAIYGNSYNLNTFYFDLGEITDYDTSRISFSLSVASPNNSTSGHLEVGEYMLTYEFTSNDFEINSFISDGTANAQLLAKLMITPRTLSIAQTNTALNKIFTKAYDGNVDIEITDGSQVMFGLSNLVSGDDVEVSSASFEDAMIGTGKNVNFVLGGDDALNYVVTPYRYGTILAVTVDLTFDYGERDGETIVSDVELAGRELISTLNYPFTSSRNLTSNSQDALTSTTNNFPISLSGREGSTFSHWSMNFSVTDGTDEYNFLQSAITSANMNASYNAGVYEVTVSNDSKTVSFLTYLFENDTNNYLGYYYASPENADGINIKFVANWTGDTYNINVQLQDENGTYSTSFASVQVDNDNMTTASYTSTRDYGARVEITVSLNDYANIIGFFNSTTGEEYFNGDEENNVQIEIGEDTATFVINSLQNHLYLAIKFSYDDVSITLDLTDYTGDITVSGDFIETTNNLYVWNTTYDQISAMTASGLDVIEYLGFEVSAFTFNNADQVSSIDFDTTLLSNYILRNDITGAYEILITPEFIGEEVTVILDYNHDGAQNKEILVRYQNQLNSSLDWEETPIRAGYDFAGWFSDGVRYEGVTVLNTTETLTLVAEWTIQRNTVSLTLDEHISFANSNFTYREDNGTYIFENLTFGENLEFELTLSDGYEIDTISYRTENENGDVAYSENGQTVSVSYSVPAPPAVFITATSAPLSNTITFSGEHFQVSAETANGEEITVTENSFDVASDVDVVVEITMETGYNFINLTSTSDASFTYNENNGTVTVEISGITSDVTFTVQSEARLNTVNITFDDNEVIDTVVISGVETENYSTQIRTGGTLDVYVLYIAGYRMDNADSAEFTTSFEAVSDGNNAYFGYFHIRVSSIATDGEVVVSSTRESYTITVETIVYDENMEIVTGTDNTATVNGSASASALFNTSVTLSATAGTQGDYSFAGWSRDGQNIFTNENPHNYVVMSNETIYAVFSTREFTINLVAYDVYTLNDGTGVEEIYQPITSAEFYLDDTLTPITSMTLFYGASTTIYLRVPDGYTYSGFGFINRDGSYNYILRDNSTEQMIEIEVSSADFDASSILQTMFVALTSNEVNINITSYIDFDGYHELDAEVGNITLVGENGETVNQFGYVGGTRVHYDANSFDQTTGQANSVRDFTVISYTGHDVYLKIMAEKSGYYFSSLVIDSTNVSVVRVSKVTENGGTYYIYHLFNIIGYGADVNIDVLFKPNKYILDLTFNNENGTKVDGGDLFLNKSDEMIRKVWSDGSNFSEMKVTSFADSYFSITAYVKLGFMLDEYNLSLTYDEDVLTISNIEVARLDFTDSGYRYVIHFDVEVITASTTLSINLTSQTYSVLLVDEDLNGEIIARIDNVRYHTPIDLTIANANNIHTDVLEFNATQLNVVQAKQDYYFGGYYTHDNGRGYQYINSEGNALVNFLETGYIFDEKTGTYIMSENAYEEENGNIVISLYLYWVYLKTQITFEIIPDVQINATAQDMIEGVDDYNSWFNEDMPLYIEVAFDTDITIVAPEISGYRFYKFVIQQRDVNNNALTDVESFSESVPWSTNAYDRIISMNIQIYYFARVDVQIYGGNVEVAISQDVQDARAQSLNAEGFVDTTMNFTLSAQNYDGYTIRYWQNLSTGERYTSVSSITTQIIARTTFLLYVQGQQVTLMFNEYDATNGRIMMMQINSPTGTQEMRTLGAYVNDSFVKLLNTTNVAVGDRVTFMMEIDYGYVVDWNIENITLTNITTNYYYFEMEITQDMANSRIQVIPTFSGNSVAFYVSLEFADKDIIYNANDTNNATFAGYTVYNGLQTNVVESGLNSDISISVISYSRYDVYRILILTREGTIDVTENYNYDSNILSFTRGFLSENDLAGSLMMTVEFERLYHTASLMEEIGNGTNESPYEINSIEALTYYMEKINNGEQNAQGLNYAHASYILTADIDLVDKFWTPIGTEENPFNGTFNFNGHSVLNIYHAVPYNPTYYSGLFGVIGNDVNIILNVQNYWYIFVIIAIVIVLIILLIILLVYNKKKKEKREELVTK